jgi:heme-degrading monooxygenase HmoA
VVVRVWRGRAADAGAADAYEQHFRLEVLPELERLDGFRGASLLRRADGDAVEFVALTRFTTLDAVRSFAGDDYERAVVAPAARELLVDFDERVVHYDDVYFCNQIA